MPKRSNEFQKLIRLIESQLVSKEATVEESKLLIDRRSGQTREVDIYIHSDISLHSFSMAFECTDRRRKAGTPWIEQLIGKYEALPIDKVIAVSKSGFSQPAIEVAKDSDIKLLTLEKAIDKDWLRAIKHPWEIGFTTVRFKPVQTFYGLSQSSDKKDIENIRVFSKEDEDLGSLDNFSENIIYEPLFKKTLCENIISEHNLNNRMNINDGQLVKATWRPSTKYILRDDYNFECQIEQIEYSFQCMVDETSISTDRFTYDEAQVATATKKHLGMEMIFSLIEREKQDPIFAVSAELEGPDGNDYTYEIMTNPLPLNDLSIDLVGFVIG